jgi:NADH-quinone oxidoreductase subunit L
MQGLVLAANLLALLIFWELVGALSLRLIAFQRDDPRAPEGAVRAFLTTRSADLGLYVAIAALFAGAGTIAFEAARPAGFLGAAVGIGLIVAAAGKSAQLPFQTWLSGAMAGPTPVSALLHSATMVAAGVYLLVRAEPLLAGWPLEAAAWLGAVTAVAAGLFALAQRDLKLVLASSTTSQLGLMFLAAALVPAAAVFQLICHAAGKAGAFLAAGVFQHRRDATSLAELRGVGRQERRAFLGFAIGAGSIAAVPPLAAFWSKDAILSSAEGHAAWLVPAVFASALTAAYLLRAGLALWRPAEPTGERPAGMAWMLFGTGLLAAGSVGLGAVHTPLGELLGEKVPAPTALSLGLSLAALAAGAATIAAPVRPPARLTMAAEAQLGTDAALRALVQRPVLALAQALDTVDGALDRGVDALGRGTVSLARGNDRLERGGVDRGTDALGRRGIDLARGGEQLERGGVDGAVDALARLVVRGGDQLPRLQSGQLYAYLRNTVLGIAALATVFAVAAVF